MKEKKPNILLLLTDQHRLSAVGAYGPTPCRTPHIDRLAAEGARFENTYTVCPVCSPARATIMTGLYPHTHGIVSNIYNLGCCVHELADRPTLLSRSLETAGYSLGYSGKWHLGTETRDLAFDAPRAPNSLPRTVGFEGQNFPGHGNGGFQFPEYKQYLAERGLKHKVQPWAEKHKCVWSMGELDEPLEATVPYFLAENTISLLESFRKREKPFFLWHNFWGPHEPYYAPTEFVEQYRDVEIPPWPNYEWPSRSIPGPHHVKIHPDHERLTWDDWATAIRYYYAYTTLIDSQIGRVLEYMRETGLLDETIVVFSADHGETLGSHGGLTDKGWHHFEETHRIPLIVRFPDGFAGGKVLSEFASLADLYPTFLDWAGAPYDRNAVHGRSLAPLLRGDADGWRESVVTEYGGVNYAATTQRTIRWRDWKYGYNCGGEDELYNLQADPHETVNLIRHPDCRKILETMRQRLLEWMNQTGDWAKYVFLHLLRYEYGDAMPSRPYWKTTWRKERS